MDIVRRWIEGLLQLLVPITFVEEDQTRSAVVPEILPELKSFIRWSVILGSGEDDGAWSNGLWPPCGRSRSTVGRIDTHLSLFESPQNNLIE